MVSYSIFVAESYIVYVTRGFPRSEWLAATSWPTLRLLDQPSILAKPVQSKTQLKLNKIRSETGKGVMCHEMYLPKLFC